MNAATTVARPVPHGLESVLSPGETVILLLRPSLLYIPLSSLGTLAASVAMGLLLAYLAQFRWTPWSDLDAAGFAVLLASMRLGWAWLDWINHVYVLTDRRVIARRGVLRTALYEAPLARIQNTIVVQSMRERVFRLGTLGFATAGRGTFDAFWESVSAPFAVHARVRDAIERYGRR